MIQKNEAQEFTNKKILILGAGLVGCCLALSLKKIGFRNIVIYEKYPEKTELDSKSMRSFAMSISPKGKEILSYIGLGPEIEEIGEKMHGRHFVLSTGADHFFSYENMVNSEKRVVSRNLLLKTLVNKCIYEKIQLQYDSSISAINFESKTLKVNEAQVNFELLFGCDGFHSIVRESLLSINPDIKVQCNKFQHVYYSGVIKSNTFPEEHFFKIFKKQHFMQIFSAQNELFEFFPMKNNTYSVIFWSPKPLNMSHEIFKEELQIILKTKFPQLDPLHQCILDSLHPEGISQIMTMLTNKVFYKDVCLLLGDSAHTTLPFIGQGFNLSLQDIMYLTKKLEVFIGDNNRDLVKIFEDYETNRISEGASVINLSIQQFEKYTNKIEEKLIEGYLVQEFSNYLKNIDFLININQNSTYEESYEISFYQNSIIHDLVKTIPNILELLIQKKRQIQN